MHSSYQNTSPEVHRQPWLDMVGRLTMSACAGQRMSGEASGWVGWSISRTDWNYGLGCSHGVEPSQPGQQGSMVQLLSIISSPVALSVSAARTGASAQLKHAVRHDEPLVSGMHTSCGSATVMVLVGDSSGPSLSACIREWSNFGPHPVTTD